MMRSRRNSDAFTLLELVFVLVIVSATLALAAPSLRGWSRGSKLRDCADEFLALARYARAQAIVNGVVYRLNVDSNSGRYWVTAQQGEQYVELGTEWGKPFAVPERCAISMSDEQGGAIEAVEFWPSGRTQVARVRVSAAANDVIELACPSPAEGFRIVTGDEAR
jgi:type II secretory pathway pseudopilin PulG